MVGRVSFWSLGQLWRKSAKAGHAASYAPTCCRWDGGTPLVWPSGNPLNDAARTPSVTPAISQGETAVVGRLVDILRARLLGDRCRRHLPRLVWCPGMVQKAKVLTPSTASPRSSAQRAPSTEAPPTTDWRSETTLGLPIRLPGGRHPVHADPSRCSRLVARRAFPAARL
jgi:hypothetical protein